MLSSAPTRLPPPSQDPSRHALHLRSHRQGVFRASASARSHRKNRRFDDTSSRHQYRTVPATSRRGSTARFDQDIGYVIIDVSLLRRRVATRGRGCRPPRVDFRRNTSTRHCNALASTDPPNEPITPAIARGPTRWPPQPPPTHQSPHRSRAVIY